MSDLALTLQLHNASQGRAAVKEQLLPYIGGHLQAGRRLQVEVKPIEDDRSLKQNAFYWGVVLKEISEQARIGGQRYTPDAWHELFKRQFLKRRVRKVAVAGRRKKVVSVSLGSTADLSVRAMSVYLEQVQAFAASDLDVRFSELYRPEPAPKRKKTTIDAETGEILEGA